MTRKCFAFVAFLLVFDASANEGYVDRADVDGDGFVSLYELRAAHYADPEFNRQIERMFQFFDVDGDGRISDAEKEQGKARLRAASEQPAAPVAATQESGDELAPLRIETRRRPVAAATPAAVVPTTRPAPPRPPPSAEAARQPPAASAPQSTADRMRAWIADIDSDRSGGASRQELIDSSGGSVWFLDRDFVAADRDGDGDLDADELAALVRSQERRRH